MILFSALTVSLQLSAQGQSEHREQARYRVINLGTLGGSSSAGNTINNLGWVMGSANLPDNTTAHATLWHMD